MKNERKKERLFSLLARVGILLSLIFLGNSELTAAASPNPDFYYYSGGRKITLPLSKEMIAVRFKQ